MRRITPEMSERFLRVREVYENTLERLVAEDAAIHSLASEPWRAAVEAVPLEPWEIKLYEQLFATHSMNVGMLSGNAEEIE
jgi:hypothetical protein